MSRRVLLLHPPATKAGEPPPGPAVLLSHLRRHGVEARLLDANLGAYLHLLGEGRPSAALAAVPEPPGAAAPPPREGPRPFRLPPREELLRAAARAGKALAFLRSGRALASPGRYTASVRALNLALAPFGEPPGEERLTLGDYNHRRLDPYVPAHLERLARGEEGTLFASYFRDEVLPEAAAFRPAVVAVTVTYRNQLLPAFELAGMVRRALPGATLVLGGGMVTSLRPDLLPAGIPPRPFDRVVFGPGEAALLALARGEGGAPPLAADPSAVEFVPDFSSRSPSDYLSPVPILPVTASRGCYWHRCLFCPEAVSPTHPYREYPPEEFPDLLLSLSERYGARHFHLADNAIPPRTLRALAGRCGDLAAAGIRWHGFARFEPFLADPALCRRLAASGCASLHLGLESGSPAVLARLRKGTDPAVAERVLGALRGAGVWPYVYVLLGTPGETAEDGERTLAFLERNAPAIGWLNLSIFNLPRESVFAADPGAHGIRLRPDRGGELRLYKAFDPEEGWGRDGARRFLQKRILGSPALRAIANRTPPLFTSNHAFLFPPGG